MTFTRITVNFGLIYAWGALPVFAGVSADSLSTAPGVPEINLFWQTLQVIFALALTLVLLVGTVFLFKKITRFKRFPGISGGAIRVLEIHYMDPRKAIALVKVLDRVLIIGYSDHTIATLGELTPEEAGSLATEHPPDPDIFATLLSRFSRRDSNAPGGGGGR